LLLNVVGLVGSLTETVRQRHRELALRVALGAQRWRVIGTVLGEAGRLAFAGTVLGAIGSLVLVKRIVAITGQPGLPPLWVWLAPPAALVAASLIAGTLPARRALMTNPVVILRD
jgi:ABC-type antimicrobial peptide transport system permease subunit